MVNKGGTRSDPKSDFAISLEALVEAGAHTGYLARLKRADLMGRPSKEC